VREVTLLLQGFADIEQQPIARFALRMKVFNVAVYEIYDGFNPGSSYDAYAIGWKQCVHYRWGRLRS
jgi:hypothetical protein